MSSYKEHYELQQAFQAEPGLIPRATLYDFDSQQIYAAILDRLAQPLPSGEPSPFSAKNPGSAQSILTSAIVYLQGLMAHELNLAPDLIYLQMLRLQGAGVRQSEPPVVSLKFTRTPDSVRQNFPGNIPAGIEIYSRFRPGLSCVVMDSATFLTESVTLPARLNEVESIDGLRTNEFSDLPANLAFIESVEMVDVVSYGRPPETTYEAAIRAREIYRTGERGVTDLDFQRHALASGASKANIVRGYSPFWDGYFRDLRTIAVYPSGAHTLIQEEMKSYKLADERIDVVPARVIKVDGNVQVKALSTLQDLEVFNLVAQTIRDRLNPPYGQWGDREYPKHLAEELERVQGVYAVPGMTLVDAETSQAIDFTKLMPWDLIEVQQSLTVTIDKNN